jgi:hypothetical protein
MTTVVNKSLRVQFEEAGVYAKQNAHTQIAGESDNIYWVEAIHFDNGVYMYVSGMEYPEKGLMPAEDIWHYNIAKKIIIEPLRLYKYLIPSFLIFVLLPYKRKLTVMNKLVASLNILLYRAISASLLKDEYLTPMAQELKSILITILVDMGIKEAEMTATLLANIINADNAYRYRLQDLLNETGKGRLLDNPRKEIKRLMLVNRKREVQHKVSVSNKFKLFASLISFALLHPRIKRAFRKGIQQSEYKKLLPDEGDWFWMCLRPGYDYFGLNSEERKMKINHLKYCKPSKKVV